VVSDPAAARGWPGSAAPRSRRPDQGWAARWSRDPPGVVPTELRPILQRLAIDAETRLDGLTCFARSLPPRGGPCVEHGVNASPTIAARRPRPCVARNGRYSIAWGETPGCRTHQRFRSAEWASFPSALADVHLHAAQRVCHRTACVPRAVDESLDRTSRGMTPRWGLPRSRGAVTPRVPLRCTLGYRIRPTSGSAACGRCCRWPIAQID
jgi:hypothetical protein